MDLAEMLASRGHEVTLLTACADGIPAEMMAVPGRVQLLRTWPGERGFLTRRAMQRARRVLEAAEVLHVHEVWETFNCQVTALARRLGVPYLVSPRGSLDDWSTGQKWFRKALFHALASGRVLRQAACIHCTAESELRESRRWFGGRPTVVLPNLLRTQSYADLPGPLLASDRFSIGREDRVLLFLSRLQPGKGVHLLIQSLPRVLGADPTALLVIAGEGDPKYRASLEQEAARLGVADRTRFVGFVSGELKNSLVQRARLLMLPSSHENFGNALFEAAACGCPLLVTPGVATAELLKDADAAVVVESDPAAIADAALAHLRMGDVEWAALSDRIRRWAMDYLSPERVVREYESAYRAHARIRTATSS